MNYIDMYLNQWRWPMEGIVFTPEFLNNFNSFTFNNDKFKNITNTLQYISSLNMSYF